MATQFGYPGLSVSDVVNVTINLSPLAAAFRNFGALLILGNSDVIDTGQRMRQYSNLDGIIADFGVSAPETLAADLFFSQSPQPNICYIGRWAETATKGVGYSAILTPTQRALANFTAVTTGAFNITIDGIPYQVVGLNFAAATNLNGVASILQTALQALGAGTAAVTFVWNGVEFFFEMESGTTGATSSISNWRTPTAAGKLTSSGSQPIVNATVTINGTLITFVTGTPVGSQVQIGGTIAVTLANLLTFLQSSVDVNISKMNYWLNGNVIYAESKLTGTTGATYTLAASSSPVSNITVSGATLSGGTGTDISAAPFYETLASGAPVSVNGVAAESLASCVALFADNSSLWYGLTIASNPMPATADYLAVAALIQGFGQSHIFGITTQDTSTLNSAVSSDLASQLQALNYSRTFIQYSASSPYAVASMYGRAFTVDFNANNSTITLKFKLEPGVAAELLPESYAATLKAKNCNVFVQFANNTAIIKEGVMCNGYFFDEVHGTDWLQNRIQTDVYNFLYQSPTKVPQTDPGTHSIVTIIDGSMQAAINNGLIAPGVWNAAGFGTLKQGQVLSNGYYIYAPPVATQAQADREARKSVPIQVAAKLAGAIHFVGISVIVNR